MADAKSKPDEDLGVCECGVAIWVRVPKGTIAYHVDKWYCQGCKRPHPLERAS
jgi:hypothetical protein